MYGNYLSKNNTFLYIVPIIYKSVLFLIVYSVLNVKLKEKLLI